MIYFGIPHKAFQRLMAQPELYRRATYYGVVQTSRSWSMIYDPYTSAKDVAVSRLFFLELKKLLSNGGKHGCRSK